MKKMVKKYLVELGIVCVCSIILFCTNVNAAVNKQLTDTENVNVDSSVPIAQAKIYKDINYSFLKEYKYGNLNTTNTFFDNVEQLKKANLKEGLYVKTNGYYANGDGGGACYCVEKKETIGGVKLANGLWANIQTEAYKMPNGEVWAIGNVLQFGARPNDESEDHNGINSTIDYLGLVVNSGSGVYKRGVVYVPKGEYRLGNQVDFGEDNLCFIGEGEDTVLYTDNSYRDEEGYSEFMFTCWGCDNSYLADFKIDAREEDLYHYMRQFAILYSQNVYVYNVDMNIPQATYNSYYFEDKQYSNFCCYTGNKNITVDSCRMEQMSGTYRGANVGILDLWSGGEENITIMNCDLYSNARDEQIGFFSKDDTKAFVKNVYFLNNKIHSVQLKYLDIIGNRTMCFTVAYTNSKNVDNIHIAGNHFICETDSKFMTFGELTNCFVENNIIEIKNTYLTWSMLFDSGNSSPNNIMVRNNDIFITSDQGIGKNNVVGGNLILKSNRIFADVEIPYGIDGPEVHDNKIICLKQLGVVGDNTNLTGNEVHLFNGLGTKETNRYNLAIYSQDTPDKNYVIKNNKFYDYLNHDTLVVYQSLIKLAGGFKSLEVSGNEFLAPNTRYVNADSSFGNSYSDSNGKYYKNNLFRYCYGNYGRIYVKNNKFQSVEIPKTQGVYECANNIENTVPSSLDSNLCTSVKLVYSGKEVEQIATTEKEIQLNAITFVAKTKDASGNIISEEEISGKKMKWFVSSERMGTVSENGKVARKLYGDICVYAVPLDGSGKFGKCKICFVKEKTQSIQLKKSSLQLEPGRKYYAEYEVFPRGANQSLIWKSSNPSVASVDYNGTISGLSVGNANITCYALDNPSILQTISVTVSSLTVKKINLTSSYYVFENTDIGKTKQLEVKSYYPENASNQGVGRWVSSNDEIVKVNNTGLMTITGQGTADIKIYTKEGRLANTVYVYVKPTKISNLKITSCTNDTIKLEWDALKNIYAYCVYQWNSSTNSWDALNGGKYIGDNHYTVNGLSKNTQYKFCVKACVIKWETGDIEYYYGKEAIISAKTYSYIPVTTLKLSKKCISITKKTSDELIVSYAPINANSIGLDINASLENSSIVSVVGGKMENGKKVFKISPKTYGYTNMKIKVNDGWGLSQNVKIGVVTEKMVSSAETKVTVEENGVHIEFKGLKEEANCLKEKSMTGYMIMRAPTVLYSNVGYIPADGRENYSFIDTTASAGTNYNYTVAPCYKVNDDYYCGINNGNYPVKTLGDANTARVEISEKIYTVDVGETIDLDATIVSGNDTSQKLVWDSEDGNIAVVGNDGNNLVSSDESIALNGISTGVTQINARLAESSDIMCSTYIVVKPGAVKNVSAGSTNSTVSLMWDCMENVSGYHVYRYSYPLQTWILVGNTSTNSYVEEIQTVSNLTMYKVCAYLRFANKDYEGKFSNAIEVMKTSTPMDGKSIYIRGYSGVYDGKSHDAVLVTNLEQGDIVKYSIDGKNWTTDVPIISEVKQSKIIFICLVRDSMSYYYSVVSKVESVTINKYFFNITNTKLKWNGKVQYPKFTVLNEGIKNNITVSYTGDGTKVGKYQIILKAYGNYEGEIRLDYTVELEKNKKYCVDGVWYLYNGDSKLTVTGTKVKYNKSKLVISDIASIGGAKFKIVNIYKNAFKSNKKIKTLILGSNIEVIGKNAFYNNSNLQKIVFKGKKIKKIETGAWKYTNNKLKFYIVKSKKAKLKSLLTQKTGYKETMQIVGK